MPEIWMMPWPTAVLTHSTSYFVATLGGTGATMMFCAMCAFIAKSKQLRKENTQNTTFFRIYVTDMGSVIQEKILKSYIETAK